MEYNKSIENIICAIKMKEYKKAEDMLLSLISEAKFKNIEDENNTYYCFNNYIESLLFWNIYNPKKKNINPGIDYIQVYYYLGYINIETKNFGKALEYLQTGLKWNPINVPLMFKIAEIHRMTGNIEKFKAQVEKTYLYIYSSSYMAKYYRELGWYYLEKRIFDLANALYTHSTLYENTELAREKLIYIAKQENRELKFSTAQEVKQLLLEYNIPYDFNRNMTQIILNEYQYLNKNKPDAEVLKSLSCTLYDITLDKKFMIYTNLKDEELGVSIKIPETWRYLEKSAYEKYNINKNTRFLFLTSHNQKVIVICDGKCSNKQLEEAYLLNIGKMKKQGMEVVTEYSIKGKKDIKQVFVDMKKGEKISRVFQNYLVVNDYLFNISWEVPNNIKIEELYNNISKSFAMDMVWSLKGNREDETLRNIAVEMAKSLNEEMTKGETAQKAVNEVLKKTENNLKEFSQEIPNYPTFKFYFPADLGEYTKYSENVFGIKKGNIQKIRIMISKCKSESELEGSAKKWIEKTRTQNNQEIVEYRKEKINNIPLEIYILKNDKNVKRIYKIGFANNCKITISGGLVEGKEKIINTAFEKLKWDINNSTPNLNEKSFFKEWQEDLKMAYVEFEKGNIRKTIKCLEKDLDIILKDDKTLQQDVFWKMLSYDIFKAVVLNCFYNKQELTVNNIDSLLANQDKIKNNITEFCNNFRNNNEINFINRIENISDKMLQDVLHVLMENVSKMNIELKNNISKEIQRTIVPKKEVKSIIISCPSCQKTFELKWNVPSTEKIFYCRCPNCSAELKQENPNYKS